MMGWLSNNRGFRGRYIAHLKMLVFIVLLPIFYILFFISRIKWNGGICRKCKSGRFVLIDYDSDRMFSNIYKCEHCENTLRNRYHHNELSKEDATIKIRDDKMKGLGL